MRFKSSLCMCETFQSERKTMLLPAWFYSLSTSTLEWVIYFFMSITSFDRWFEQYWFNETYPNKFIQYRQNRQWLIMPWSFYLGISKSRNLPTNSLKQILFPTKTVLCSKYLNFNAYQEGKSCDDTIISNKKTTPCSKEATCN